MGSQFMDHEHTLKHLRNPGLWMPSLGDRQTYDEWCSKAQKLEQRAAAEARHILETHEVTPLDKEILIKMNRIIVRAQGSVQ